MQASSTKENKNIIAAAAAVVHNFASVVMNVSWLEHLSGFRS